MLDKLKPDGLGRALYPFSAQQEEVLAKVLRGSPYGCRILWVQTSLWAGSEGPTSVSPDVDQPEQVDGVRTRIAHGRRRRAEP